MSTFPGDAEFDQTSDGQPQSSTQEHIGPYRLLQVLGEGGMGTVWLAEQKEPVRRRVALKLIRPGANDRHVVARFEAERQALALMNHPHIAKVLDAGTTESNQPYFVMELVSGVPITDYCDKNRLSITERLQLFTAVCEAVQHAHQKGIIHRDLKPSNVMVCLEDGRPTPKVIDFGLAKALQHQMQLTDKTMFTQFGQVVGTVQYMSPEQADMSHLDIDTRTDIYSLGVMLYELLTGSTPIDPKVLETGTLLNVLKTIREQEPPRPSVRLSSVQVEVASGISESRRVDSPKLRRLLRGDLDWIVMKALEIDRTRRYETANGLAMDVRRYVAGDPIQARPPTPGYRLQKFVRKNRGVFVTLTAFAVLLCVGIVLTSFLAVSANRARRQAELSEQIATAAARREESLRLSAEKARARADQEAIRAQAAEDSALEAQAEAEEQATRAGIILDFVVSSFAGLDPQANEQIELGSVRKDRTAKDVLDQTAEQLMLSTALGMDPLGKALLLNRLGNIYREFDELDRAISLLSKADVIFREELGTTDLQTIYNLRNLANAYLLKNPSDAVPIYESCLQLHRQHHGTDSAYFAALLGAYGISLKASGDPKGAMAVLEQALELSNQRGGEDSREGLKLQLYLGACHESVGDVEQALSLHRQVHADALRIYGENDWIAEWARNYLSKTMKLRGRWAEALPIDQQSLAYAQAAVGNVHPTTVKAFTRLGLTYEVVGDLQQAWNTRSTLFQYLKRSYGLNDPRTLASFSQLVSMFEKGQFEGWDEYVESVLIELKGKDLDAFTSSDRYLEALWSSARQFAAEQHVEEAVRLYRLVLERRKSSLGADDPRTLATSLHVARFLREQSQTEELERLVEYFPLAANVDAPVIEVRGEHDEFQPMFDALVDLDFQVTDIQIEVDAEQVTRIAQFQPEWLPRNLGRAFWLRSQETPAGFRSRNDRMTSRGYTLQRRIDYEVGGQSYVAALWTRRMRPPVWSEETDVAVASESDGETFGELDQNVARFMAEHQVPGLALAIARGGAIQYSRGFGWSVIGDESVEPETRFRIASVSKILTALAIYQLLEQGRLTLDDPMIEHLPNQCLPPVADRDERLARVTIRHLLNHSAGWDSERDPVFRIHDIARQSERQLPLDNREFIRLVLGQPLDYEPGEKGEYISFGYQILGRIIAHRGGLPYEEFVKRQILVPLGMNDTSLGRTRLMDRGEMEAVYYPMFEQSVSQETDGITSASGLAYGRGWTLENLDAAGGWVSTAPDLLRLVHGVARDRSPKLLSAESWTQFFSNPQMGYGSDWSSTYHANGWVVRPGESGNTCWATGFLTGSSCFVAYFGEEEDQFATALIANASDTPKGEQLVDFLDRLQYQLIRRYDGDFAITRASHVSDGPE